MSSHRDLDKYLKALKRPEPAVATPTPPPIPLRPVPVPPPLPKPVASRRERAWKAFKAWLYRRWEDDTLPVFTVVVILFIVVFCVRERLITWLKEHKAQTPPTHRSTQK